MAELVARLEGIPLALELAAARVRSLTVAEINVRLKDRYKVLSGGARVALERQQTLRALVDWSYDLLQKDEQVLLARLAVFANGFELASAEEVCGVDPLDTGGRARPAHLPDREIDGPDGGAEGQNALQDARDHPGLRRGEADPARRARGDRRAALQPLFRDGEGWEQGPEWARARRMDPAP